jgi:RES domain-containing protein
MKVYRIGRCEYINDLSGTGASLYGGRWHSKGTYILYTSSSASLALLESVVHISNIQVFDFCMICLEIPDFSIEKINVEKLPANWFENPSADALKIIGDEFISANESLALELPSAIVPEENNYLLNPFHSLFAKVKVLYVRNIAIDKRLMKQQNYA